MAKGIKGKKLGKIVHHLNQPGATQKEAAFSKANHTGRKRKDGRSKVSAWEFYTK